jgi:hypothetical protein
VNGSPQEVAQAALAQRGQCSQVAAGPVVRALSFRRGDERVRPPARRFYPSRGQLLTLADVRGPWRPSGTAGGAGVFAVVWSTQNGDLWAPLHDFEANTVLLLIEACKDIDAEQFGGRR